MASAAIPAGWAAWMSPIAKRTWKRLAPMLVNAGVLGETDLMAFRILCETYAEWITLTNYLRRHGRTYEIITKGGDVMVYDRPEVAGVKTARNDFLKYSARFGITPSDRAKIDLGRVEDERPDYLD